jgi:2-C-methyl-D-erythritol 4-phosphate cytidylyltransferase
MKEKYNLIIPCAGSGQRFKSNIPKQFIKINNKTLLEYTLKKFESTPVGLCVLAVARDYLEEVQSYIKDINFPVKAVEGGETRAHSVKNALQACLDYPYTLIHDAVRPYVSQDVIERVLNQLKISKAVIPAVSVVDTIKEVKDNKVIKTLHRASLASIQTPQGFHTTLLKQVYAHDDIDNFTDDASLLEAYAYSIDIVQGDSRNKKITEKTDSDYFKFYLDFVQKNS